MTAFDCYGPGDNEHASPRRKLSRSPDRLLGVALATGWDGALASKARALNALVKSELMASIARKLIGCDINPAAVDFDLDEALELPDAIGAEIDYLVRMFTAHILRKQIGTQAVSPLTSRQAELVTTYIQQHFGSNITIGAVMLRRGLLHPFSTKSPPLVGIETRAFLPVEATDLKAPLVRGFCYRERSMVVRIDDVSPEELRIMDEVDRLVSDQDIDFVISVALTLFINSLLTDSQGDATAARASVDHFISTFSTQAKETFDVMLAQKPGLYVH